jgi:ppGpp synthetase/RelA/SpoT-type nucleotidyltranferase
VDQIIDQLLAGGHLGLFAAFLVWQFIALQKRLDRLVESFQSQLKDINDNYDQRLVSMRERYDAVLREARTERDQDAREFMATRAKIQEQITAKLDRLLESKN